MKTPIRVTRHAALKSSATVAAASFASPLLPAHGRTDDTAARAVELAHREMWRRFVDVHGIVLDYTNLDGTFLRPSAEECRLGKPNAVGWLTPIANGAMFSGLYLDAAILRAQQTGVVADKANARRLVEGLLLLASVGEVKGFIARGVATDGRSTYPLGSNDQTGPWFYGLWRYLRSGLPDNALQQRIIARMTDVADVLEGTGWKMPAAKPFNFRGSFAEHGWDGSPRLLFLMKVMHALTGHAKWAQHYEESLHEKDGGKPTRLEACALGVASRPKPRMWTGSVSVACLRELWELEHDQAVRSQFAQGLSASAEFAATQLPQAREFENESARAFDGDWRKLNELWRPQASSTEASAVSAPQRSMQGKQSPRMHDESSLVREPAFASWIVALCPDSSIVARHRAAVLDTIAHYRCDRLYLSTFFPLESAWWRLQGAV
jgi:hypothetical protein